MEKKPCTVANPLCGCLCVDERGEGHGGSHYAGKCGHELQNMQRSMAMLRQEQDANVVAQLLGRQSLDLRNRMN